MKKIFFTGDEMCTMRKLAVSRVQDFYIKNNWVVAENPAEADLIAVLTCSGWTELEYNSLKNLSELQKYGGKVVCVGCTNEANPQEVKKIHSGETVSGRNIEDLARFVENPAVPFEQIQHASTFRRKEDYRLYDLTKRFVNIAEGCGFSCVYCTHKPGLGPQRSRPMDSIIDQIENMIRDHEVKTIVLTGMETSLYGRDIGVSYPDLIEAVLALDERYKIHVAQFTPSGAVLYGERLLKSFTNKRVADIQIPIQSTSSRILKMMKRPRYQDELYEFLSQVRKQNPSAILRTDIIVGFPSETREEFEHTLKYATELFDEIAVYKCEIKDGLPIEKYKSMALDEEELQDRVSYAKGVIAANGLLAHGGQQESPDLSELERLKQKMRVAKGQDDE
jgi:tRNA A37 methylthiotransferase MiaB